MCLLFYFIFMTGTTMTWLTWIVNDVTTAWLAEATSLMSTPLGLFIAFGIGVTLIGVVITVIKKFV